MYNERIICGPILGSEDAPYGGRGSCVGTEAVNRLGWEGHGDVCGTESGGRGRKVGG